MQRFKLTHEKLSEEERKRLKRIIRKPDWLEKFFVMETGDIRTHHIHIVKWNGADWNNYVNFRDYLNANPEKAMMYDDFKQKLAIQFSNDRKSYTAGKQEIIGRLLSEASIWKMKSMTTTSKLSRRQQSRPIIE